MFKYGCFLTIVIVFLCSLFEAWVIMLLWNWLMPMLFGLPEIGLWQMYGLMILANFVFSMIKN